MAIYFLSLSTDPTQLRWLTRRVGRHNVKCCLMMLECFVYDFEKLFNDFEMFFNDFFNDLSSR